MCLSSSIEIVSKLDYQILSLANGDILKIYYFEKDTFVCVETSRAFQLSLNLSLAKL